MIEEIVESIFFQGFVPNEREVDATLVFMDDSFAEMSQWQGEARAYPLPHPSITHGENLHIYPLSADMSVMKKTIISVLAEYLEDAGWDEETKTFQLSSGQQEEEQKGKSNSSHRQQWLIVIATASLDIECISSIQYLLTTLSVFSGENNGQLLIFPQCLIVTTVSPPALSQYSYSLQTSSTSPHNHDREESSSSSSIAAEYARFLEYLSPAVPTQVLYLPKHSVDLLHHLPLQPPLSSNMSTSLTLNIVANQSLRSIAPLTLHHLQTKHQACVTNSTTDEPFQSITEITAADLPMEVKQSLKSFAYELAGSLVFGLALDAESSIYTMGKTSSLVGHSLQDILPSVKKLRNENTSENGSSFVINIDPNSSVEATPSLQKASVILIDRSEDWYTPASFTGVETQSLAHRVYNALKFPAADNCVDDEDMANQNQCLNSRNASKSLDVAIQPLSITLIQEALGEDMKQCLPNEDSLFRPMSALASLAFQWKPSICYHSDSNQLQSTSSSSSMKTTDHMRQLFFCRSEEQLRIAVVDMLKEVIVTERGTLPPNKKRGLGAEILAYVQALLDAPGANNNGECKEAVMSRHLHLLSLCLSIIETMQRSSGKQFMALCDWKCAIDVRYARDMDLSQTLKQASALEDFDMIVSKLMKSFFQTASSSQKSTTSSVNTSISSTASSPQKAPKSSAGSKQPAKGSTVDDSKDGPPDAIHIILQLVGLLSLYRFQVLSIEFIDIVAAHLARYLLDQDRHPAELRYMYRIGFLSSSIMASIREFRDLLALEGDEQESSRISYQEALQDLLVNDVLKPLTEMCVSYSMRNQQLMEKDKFDLISDSPFNLLEYSLKQNGADRSAALQFMNRGLLATVVEDCISLDSHDENHEKNTLSHLVDHVESGILQHMAKTGLDLLSKSIGRFGFSFGESLSQDSSNHPAKEDIIVIAVIGGISLKEVAQIQNVVSSSVTNNKRIVIVSNNIINGEATIAMLFN